MPLTNGWSKAQAYLVTIYESILGKRDRPREVLHTHPIKPLARVATTLYSVSSGRTLSI